MLSACLAHKPWNCVNCHGKGWMDTQKSNKDWFWYVEPLGDEEICCYMFLTHNGLFFLTEQREKKRVLKMWNTNHFDLSRIWQQNLCFDTSSSINLKTQGNKNQWVREMDHSLGQRETSQLVSNQPMRPRQSVKMHFSGAIIPLTKREKPQVPRRWKLNEGRQEFSKHFG